MSVEETVERLRRDLERTAGDAVIGDARVDTLAEVVRVAEGLGLVVEGAHLEGDRIVLDYYRPVWAVTVKVT